MKVSPLTSLPWANMPAVKEGSLMILYIPLLVIWVGSAAAAPAAAPPRTWGPVFTTTQYKLYDSHNVNRVFEFCRSY